MGVYAAAAGAVYKGMGSAKASKAASDAAAAQEAEARRQRGETLAFAGENGRQTMDFAKASPQELRAYEASLGAGEKQLASDQRLMDAIDPSVMEASKQILGILRGDTSSGIMAPYAAQRSQQRQQVINQLRQKYGPGGESTSAGQKALRDFDLSANMQGAQIGQGELGSLFGVIGSRPTLAGSANMLDRAGANFSGIQNRLTNASTNTGNQMLAAMAGTGAPVLASSGSAYLGSELSGRSMDQMGNQFLNFASQAAGQGMSAFTGGMGGSKSSGNAAPPPSYGTAGGSYRDYGNTA